MRFVKFVQDQAADGRLGDAELEERIEQIFRARSITDLEAVVAGLPGASVLSLDAALAGEFQQPARGVSWLRRLVLYTVVVDALGVVVWAFTGGGVVWLVVLFMGSAAVFAFRVTRRGKGLIGGRSRRRK